MFIKKGLALHYTITIKKNKPTMPTIINIEQLRENIDFIATSMASYMCDCLVISLTEAGHSVGINIKVETDLKDYDFSIFWETKVTQHLIGATRDEQRTTEWAAMGFAFILVRYLTEYPYIRTSRKGSGIDFFLSKNPTELSCDAFWPQPKGQLPP